MRRAFKILENLLWVVILAFLALVAITFLPIKGNYKVFTVQSGSMEPAIHLGSLIFVKAQNDYQVGDIVTRTTSDPKVSVTHRIISRKAENGQTIFETKGDANEDPDGESLIREKIIGKEFFNLPYIGYPIGYARTVPGFIILIVIPAVIIIYDELRKIKAELLAVYKKKKEKPRERYVFEEEYIRPSDEYNIRKIAFDARKSIAANRNNRRRKMDL